jgi:hypothetical protein
MTRSEPKTSKFSALDRTKLAFWGQCAPTACLALCEAAANAPTKRQPRIDRQGRCCLFGFGWANGKRSKTPIRQSSPKPANLSLAHFWGGFHGPVHAWGLAQRVKPGSLSFSPNSDSTQALAAQTFAVVASFSAFGGAHGLSQNAPFQLGGLATSSRLSVPHPAQRFVAIPMHSHHPKPTTARALRFL